MATETDIFQQQKKTIDTLIDVLAEQGKQTASQPQIVYAQPEAEGEKQTPNYTMYLLLGAVILILFIKK